MPLAGRLTGRDGFSSPAGDVSHPHPRTNAGFSQVTGAGGISVPGVVSQARLGFWKPVDNWRKAGAPWEEGSMPESGLVWWQ